MLSALGGWVWNGFVSERNVIAVRWDPASFVGPKYTESRGTLSRTSKAFDTTFMEWLRSQ